MKIGYTADNTQWIEFENDEEWSEFQRIRTQECPCNIPIKDRVKWSMDRMIEIKKTRH